MAESIQILVTEDEPQLRDSVALLLREQGYEVMVASSGNEAIPLIYGRQFNLVVLDLKMPYIDGFEVLTFIKSTFPGTHVIVLTAYADLTNVEKCRRLGADEVIGKPYNFGYLLSAIDRLLKPAQAGGDDAPQP
jgi:DNA-binding response OmpR family regulator